MAFNCIILICKMADQLLEKNCKGLFLKCRKNMALIKSSSTPPPPSSWFSWVVKSNQFTVWVFQGVKKSTFHLHK